MSTEMQESIKQVKEFLTSPEYMLTKTEVAVLEGMLSGDGDLGGRMASSSEFAVSPVDEDRQSLIDMYVKRQQDLGQAFDVAAFAKNHLLPE